MASVQHVNGTSTNILDKFLDFSMHLTTSIIVQFFFFSLLAHLLRGIPGCQLMIDSIIFEEIKIY